ncbi:MAG: MerR family transcriptional regulator [Solirubrobacterales bacterium]
MAAEPRMLRMKQLAEEADVSAATIKHYLREGLLPEPVRTSRNMAWYPEEFVERLRLIRRLQDERFLPLKVIRELLDDDPSAARAMLDEGDRFIEQTIALREGERTPRDEVAAAREVPESVLLRLEELGILADGTEGYEPEDIEIVDAIARFRAGGYDEAIGFTVYETLRYREALEPLVAKEVDVLLERLAGTMEPDRAVDIVASGAAPLRDLIGAMHSKLLLAELRRRRGTA